MRYLDDKYSDPVKNELGLGHVLTDGPQVLYNLH